ncbi:unnamed protein product [[Candida] boidinii]|nr:unnamed protein product [[Candida] boidinii]
MIPVFTKSLSSKKERKTSIASTTSAVSSKKSKNSSGTLKSKRKTSVSTRDSPDPFEDFNSITIHHEDDEDTMVFEGGEIGDVAYNLTRSDTGGKIGSKMFSKR